MVKIITDNFFIDNIKLVVFDKDGTIFDLHKYWSFVIKERARYFSMLASNSNTNEIMEDLINSMGLVECNKLSKNGPVGVKSRAYIIDLVYQIVKKYKAAINKNEIENGFRLVDTIADKNLDKIVNKLPGVDKLIQSLVNHKCLIAMATSDISERANNTLTHAKLIDYFDYISASDQVDNPKPHGDIIFKIISNFNNIMPSDVVLIGDSIVDLNTAKNSGINFIGVNTGSNSDEFIQKSDFLVDSLLDIKIVKSLKLNMASNSGYTV